MNIKNPEAQGLARQVAALTGESMTQAVTTALRERLERLVPEQPGEAERRHARIAAIVGDFANYADQITPSDRIGDELYHPKTGVPR